MRREKSAGAVVYNPQTRKYLLLHYPTGHWDFPKGHVEPRESEVKTAKREVFEETGLDVEILFGFHEIICYKFRERDTLVEKKVVYFIGLADNENVKLSYEHDGYIWLPYDEAVERITYDTSKKVLMKAHLFLRNLGYVS